VGGLVALFGSLAPGGAILKRPAADARLFETEARAVVFESLEDLAARIDDPGLDVAATDVLVLKNAGPRAAGMPEAAYLPIPRKLARAGDRISMSVKERRLDLLVDETQLARRRASAPPSAPPPRRGYRKLYLDHVRQADAGCDFDFPRAGGASS
jgi:dihydroxy-acid dehydratase